MRRRNSRYPGIWYFADDTSKEGDGGGSGGGAPANVEATVRRIMQEGRTEQKLVDLHLDNHKLRQQLKDAEGGTKVPEGGKVLDADEAKAWEAYTALGKPDEVKKTADRAKELEDEVAKRDRTEQLRSAVNAAGYGDGAETALMELRSLEGAAFEVKEEKDGDETVTVPYVTLAGEGQKQQKLDAFLEEKYPVIRRALVTEETQGSATSGPTYPSQKSGEGRSKEKASQEDFRRATERTASYTL